MGKQSKTVAIITSRSASTRFPDKFNADICGKPMLLRVVERVRQSNVDEVVVATVEGDVKLINFCELYDIPYFAGSEEDILDRLYHAATTFDADTVVRVWGDSPLVNPEQINKALALYDGDYVTITTKYGVIAVMPFETLQDAWVNIKDDNDRHWIHVYLSKQGIITVDRVEDLEEVCKIWKKLEKSQILISGITSWKQARKGQFSPSPIGLTSTIRNTNYGDTL